MSTETPTRISFSFPATVDLVGMVRVYVSNLLHAQGFSEGFSYRTEIVIDELWRNAVIYGMMSPTARIEIILNLYKEYLELSIINDGGTQKGLEMLQQKMAPVQLASEEALGLNIVRILTDSISAKLYDDKRLAVTIVRKKIL